MADEGLDREAKDSGGEALLSPRPAHAACEFATSVLRSVLLKPPALPLDQMIRVDKGVEPCPVDWPRNWKCLLLINQTLDLMESHEWEIERMRDSAIKLRAIYDKPNAAIGQ